MSEGVQKEIEELNTAASAFMKSQILLVANQYDLFSEIEGQQLAAQEISGLLKICRFIIRAMPYFQVWIKDTQMSKTT